MQLVSPIGGGHESRHPASYARRIKRFARILRLKPHYQEQRASAFAERWALIEQGLRAEDCTLLDIGCNIGQFTASAAARGMFAIGIDAQDEIVARARRLHAQKPGVAFAWLDINPESVNFLPSADVTLCLSVHHYWTRLHGDAVSWQMIAALLARTRTLYFEPASAHVRYGANRPEFADNEPASINAYVMRNFTKILPPGRAVERIGVTPSIKTESFRLLYRVS